MAQPKNSEKSVPKSGVLAFETFRNSPPLLEMVNGNKQPVEAMRELDISRSCYYRLFSRLKPVFKEANAYDKKGKQ